MYIIAKRFSFSASHSIPSLPDGHKCKRLHGHNYVVEVELTGEHLNEHGFVRDFGDFAHVKRWIDSDLDHRHLNDVLGDDYTTAEKIAEVIYDFCAHRWPETSAVTVWETPNCWARYIPG